MHTVREVGWPSTNLSAPVVPLAPLPTSRGPALRPAYQSHMNLSPANALRTCCCTLRACSPLLPEGLGLAVACAVWGPVAIAAPVGLWRATRRVRALTARGTLYTAQHSTAQGHQRGKEPRGDWAETQGPVLRGLLEVWQASPVPARATSRVCSEDWSGDLPRRCVPPLCERLSSTVTSRSPR